MRKARILSAFAVVALVAAACSGETAAITTTSTVPPTTTTTTLPPDPAVDGPVFRVALTSSLTTTNWWAAVGTESTPENRAVLAATKASLFTLSYPGFVLVPSLAATTSPQPATQQGSTWTVTQTLREDVEWSDGELLTTHDLVFYFDVVREFGLGTGHREHFPASVVDVSAVDDFTVRIEFDQLPSLTDWQTGVARAPFVPAHFWEPHLEAARDAADEARSAVTELEARAAIAADSLADEDPDNDLTPEEVAPDQIESHRAGVAAKAGRTHLYSVDGAGEPGAGSQVFAEWTQGESAITRSNPSHFARGTETISYSDGSVRVADPVLGDNVYGGNASGEVTAHAVVGPFISAIEWLEFASTDEAYAALSSGEVDYVLDPDGMSFSRYNELATQGGIGLSISQADGFRFLGFNLRKPPMSDPVFREAVATVIDKELFAGSLFNGTLFPAYTVVHPGITAFFNSEAPRAGWSNDAPLRQKERYERAISTLVEAGYSWSTEPEIIVDDEGEFLDIVPGVGLIMPNGLQVPSLTMLAGPGSVDDPMRTTVALWIEQWLTDLGIDVDTQPTDLETISDTVVAPDSSETAFSWDLHVLGWGRPDEALPGLTHVALFHSRNGVEVGGLNTTGYASGEFDEAADAFVASADLEDAAFWTMEMERIVAEDLPYVVLYRAPVIEGHRSGVEFAVDAIMGGHASVPMDWPATVRVSR